MKYNNYSIPVFVFIGASGVGKSTIISMLTSRAYRRALKKLTGRKNTTHILVRFIFDPRRTSASIRIKKINSPEMLVMHVRAFLQDAFSSFLKHTLSSLPQDALSNEDARERFVRDFVSNNLYPNKNYIFNLKKLIEPNVESKNGYSSILHTLYNALLESILSDYKHLKANYTELKKSDDDESTKLLDELVEGFLVNSNSMSLMSDIAQFIYDSGIENLVQNGFSINDSDGVIKAEALELDADAFNRCVDAVTNSKNRQSEDIVSSACLIADMTIYVPAEAGLNIQDGNMPFCVYDSKGIDNDGHKLIQQNVDIALKTPADYDGIVFIKEAKYNEAIEKEFFEAIQKSIRPSKLIAVITHADMLADMDDEIEFEDVHEDLERIRKETVNTIKAFMTKECRVISPDYNDVICCGAFKPEQSECYEKYSFETGMHYLRQSLEKAYNTVRAKVKAHNVDPEQAEAFITASNWNNGIGRNLTNAMFTSINDEYCEFRDYAYAYHHWTVTAVLASLLRGENYQSYAKVYRNINVRTFSNIPDACKTVLGEPSLITGFDIRDSNDKKKVLQEFEANLTVGLIRAAKELILDNDGVEDEIRRLWATPKYDKRQIFTDLKTVLLSICSDDAKIQQMVKEAIETANKRTFERLFI